MRTLSELLQARTDLLGSWRYAFARSPNARLPRLQRAEVDQELADLDAQIAEMRE